MVRFGSMSRKRIGLGQVAALATIIVLLILSALTIWTLRVMVYFLIALGVVL